MSIDEGPFQNIVDVALGGGGPEFYTLNVKIFYGRGPNINFNLNAPESDADCNVSCVGKSWTVADTRLIGSFGWRTRWRGMGWEDPPHPQIRLTGQSSGSVATLAEHCAKQLASCWTVSQFNDYAMNIGHGGDGVDFIVDEGSTNDTDFPYLTGTFHVAYIGPVGNDPPWTNGEAVTLELLFTTGTLPDPGPYNIVSARAHATLGGTTVLTLDRAIRFASPSALCIAGTTSGTYDGMKFGYEWGDHASHAAEDISVTVPFTTGVTTGTVLRHFDQDFDQWYGAVFPTGPAPSLPTGC